MVDRPFRLLPDVTERTRPFWTSGAEGRLVFQRCDECGYYAHPPGPRCPRCLSPSSTPSAVTGRGSVVSFTVNEQAWNPTMPPPYVIGLVELDEQQGLRLMTNLVDCAPADVRIDMRVRVVFEQHEDVWVPLFTPVVAP